MNGLSFYQVRRIQFVAANYSRLQGLRGLPVGLLLFGMALWANLQRGPAPRPVLIPLLLGATAAVLYWLVDRYYKRAFGWVKPAPRGHLDWLVGIGGAAIALAAFIIENTSQLLFSPTGLVLAMALLVDYLMLIRIAKIHYMPFWPAFTGLVVIFSVLPLFGLDGWWAWVGVKTQILAVMMASGLIMTFASVTSHIFFIRMLPQEALYGGRV